MGGIARSAYRLGRYVHGLKIQNQNAETVLVKVKYWYKNAEIFHYLTCDAQGAMHMITSSSGLASPK